MSQSTAAQGATVGSGRIPTRKANDMENASCLLVGFDSSCGVAWHAIWLNWVRLRARVPHAHARRVADCWCACAPCGRLLAFASEAVGSVVQFGLRRLTFASEAPRVGRSLFSCPLWPPPQPPGAAAAAAAPRAWSSNTHSSMRPSVAKNSNPCGCASFAALARQFARAIAHRQSTTSGTRCSACWTRSRAS